MLSELNKTRCAIALINAGANVKSKWSASETPPLIWAVKYSQDKTVKALIEAGADVNTCDWEGFNALGRCYTSAHYA